MAHQNYYRSPFGDTTYTKVFVGGLAWETPTDVLKSYFEQFGEILEAVIITDKHTGKSKGYGFVTFRDPESATRACADPRPVIDGRRANCNIAALGPPPGRNQVGKFEGGGVVPHQGVSSSTSFSGVAGPLIPPVQPASPIIYPPYGYMAYSPNYSYHQAIYSNQQLQQQAQYYNQLYGGIGTSSSAGIGNYPYNFGGYYSMEASPKGAFPTNQTQRFYYPTTTQLDGSFSSYPRNPIPFEPRNTLPSSSDPRAAHETSSEAEAGAATSESPNT
ncbi:hypothetical protein Leryth_026816 [Lithospermum erythrorhizon]|nr:hypothetical protein Leryth_026816 [Lithospermum erythrorhizon]